MNPCPCGYAGDPRGRCHCTAEQIARYRHRISGPLIDRIDIHVELTALPVGAPARRCRRRETENSATVAAARRRRPANANAASGQIQCAADTRSKSTSFCGLRRETRESCSARPISRLGLSARACHRVLKLARTCADLAAEPEIRRVDVAEAVQLRALDKFKTSLSGLIC